MKLTEIRKKYKRLTDLKKKVTSYETEINNAEVDGFYRTNLYVLLHDLNGDRAGELFHSNVLTVEEFEKGITFDLKKVHERSKLKDLILQSKIVFIGNDAYKFILDIIFNADLSEEEVLKIGESIFNKLDHLKVCDGYGIGAYNVLYIFLLKNISKQLQQEIKDCYGKNVDIIFTVTGKMELY